MIKPRKKITNAMYIDINRALANGIAGDIHDIVFGIVYRTVQRDAGNPTDTLGRSVLFTIDFDPSTFNYVRQLL